MKENKNKKEKKKITIFSDFKAFILRGNIMDLAVAVVIGGAFGKIVTSLVSDIIMPLLSLVLGGKSFSDLKWTITAADETNGITETALNYGNFIQSIIDFLIIALCIFLAIRLVGNISRKINDKLNHIGDALAAKQAHSQSPQDTTESTAAQDAQDTTAQSAQDAAVQAKETITDQPKPTQEELLTQIRDLLRAQSQT